MVFHFPCGVVVQLVFMYGEYLVRLFTVIGAMNLFMGQKFSLS
jgi:hypothetical protein